MSNHWDLICRDCNKRAGFSCNHGDGELRDLWSHAAAWAGLAGISSWAKVAGHIGISYGCFPFGGMTDFPEFAAKHLGHDVVPWSEYGYAFDECATHLACPTCKHGKTCRLKKGHDGEHSSES